MHFTTKLRAIRTLGVVPIDRHFLVHIESLETSVKEIRTGPRFATAMFYQLTLVSKKSVVGISDVAVSRRHMRLNSPCDPLQHR